MKQNYCAIFILIGFICGDAAALTSIPNKRLFGYMDKTGKTLIEPACDYASFPPDGDWIVLNRNKKEGFLNLATGDTTGFIYDVNFSNPYVGRSPSFKNGPEPVYKSGKFGYVRSDGTVAIPFIYEDATPFFENGLAIIKLNDKYGYIDSNGNTIIQPTFDRAFPFTQRGLAVIWMDNYVGAIDKTGKIVIPPQYDSIDLSQVSDLIVVGLKGAKGIANELGMLVYPLTFNSIRTFSANGLAAASKDALPSWRFKEGQLAHWGFIDKTGEFVIPPIYNEVSDFQSSRHEGRNSSRITVAPPNLAEAVTYGPDGSKNTVYLDNNGKVAIALPAGLYGMGVQKNGLIMARDELRVKARTPSETAYDPIEKKLFYGWYDWIGDFADQDIAPFKINDLVGFMDRSENVVIPPSFASASPFSKDGIALVYSDSIGQDKFGFIDKAGHIKTVQRSGVILHNPNDEYYLIIETQAPNKPNKLPPEECGVFKR